MCHPLPLTGEGKGEAVVKKLNEQKLCAGRDLFESLCENRVTADHSEVSAPRRHPA
jgi:hypothetical protein